MNDSKKWLFVSEVAKIFRVHPRTVRRWISENSYGLIVRKVGRQRYQIREDSLEGVTTLIGDENNFAK